MRPTEMRMISAESIAKIFAHTIGVPVGSTDNFFDIGGDSLLAEEVMTALSDLVGHELELALLLDFQTPEELAHQLARIGK